jgi:hypothetical protein
MRNVKPINQNQLKILIKDRLDRPELYENRPLIIWRSDFRDGIIQRVVNEAFSQFNISKPDDERKWYSDLMLAEDTPPSGYGFSEPQLIEDDGTYLLGMYVLETIFAEMDYNYEGVNGLNKYYSFINDRRWGKFPLRNCVPTVVFMCYNYEWFETPEKYPLAEQYLFAPDFDEWVKSCKKLSDVVIDFIKGNGNRDEIIYRWYNYFNCYDFNNRNGCDFPVNWIDAVNSLRLYAKSNKRVKPYEIDEDYFKGAFSGHFSQDIIDEFYLYIQQLKPNTI